ncbi:Uu.00g107130.m01.CDS01 [Anthostomella pinea]|uniref:Uu.00g107130.m01.CDS01 n=1 Tax=Anthostomella pinea TaxID=933095 RepID=A0AAI8VES1_9PEZI|nr:Uu.00g107130.m01.CDS01 [Anthostomella pinea]
MAHPQTLFPQTSFHGPSMLASRRATIIRVTVKAQLKRLKETGQFACFDLKWQPIYGDKSRWPAPPTLYWDSDVAKWIEGACYMLTAEYDAEVDAAVRELVDKIRHAQREDGYLNVYFTVIEPERRWSNIRDQHELYNAGHLIEAALAHSNYYKNDLLIDPLEKYVKLIRSVFGPGKDQRHGYPGHPEIELALLRLYTATRNQDAYELAQYFLEERGNPTGQDGMRYYGWERVQRGDSPWKRPNCYPMSADHWYNQAHKPILEQKSVEGHAVRAMYLYTGVADLLCLDELGLKPYGAKSKYFETLCGLWNNMVDKKMYLTGGVGSMWQWEGFGIDYFLPQGSAEGGCYSETCASIGVMMLAERMLHLDLNSKYADIMELCLYNTVMTAMSLEGSAFTYVNQLASSESDKSARETWFDTSCCPPNLTRLFGSIGGYLWDYGGDETGNLFVNVHLYTTAKVTFEVDGKTVVLEQRSDWPWDGKVFLQLQAPSSAATTIRLRLPAWAEKRFTLTPTLESPTIQNGYVILRPSYTSANKAFTIDIHGFKPRYISPHPYTNQQTLTLARGPLIYCVEDADNAWEQDHFRNVGITSGSGVTEHQGVLDKPGERFIALRTVGWVRKLDDEWARAGPGLQPGSHTTGSIETEARDITFIPYYLRANRGGNGHMRVGLLRQ